jgi:hypothetical protein
MKTLPALAVRITAPQALLGLTEHTTAAVTTPMDEMTRLIIDALLPGTAYRAEPRNHPYTLAGRQGRVPRPPRLTHPRLGAPRDRRLHRWFNGTRLHSALGYVTPNDYEAATRKEDLARVA